MDVGARAYTPGMSSGGDPPHAAIVDAADIVAEKIDVLLERAVDVVLDAPRAGSPQWRQAWESRDSESGRTAAAQRARVKAAIAELAGLRTEASPHAAPRPRRRDARASQTTSQQLAIW